MLDIWYTFPATMGEDQAWITYNHGYAEVSKVDKRNDHLRIRIKFKNPTEHGMPTNEEYPKLSALDEKLDKAIDNIGGVYVGRITVAGKRYFYYYLDTAEKKVKNIIDKIADSSSYKIQYQFESDIEKKKYWEELYPTFDDWQVIEDLKVLDSLAENGDKKEIKREVQHWAYFSSSEDASKYNAWVIKKFYKVIFYGQTDDKKEYMVQYSHVGTMDLGDITQHTISANRKARELNGRYDGWETSVEK